MTTRPGRVQQVIQVTRPRPRYQRAADSPELGRRSAKIRDLFVAQGGVADIVVRGSIRLVGEAYRTTRAVVDDHEVPEDVAPDDGDDSLSLEWGTPEVGEIQIGQRRSWEG